MTGVFDDDLVRFAAIALATATGAAVIYGGYAPTTATIALPVAAVATIATMWGVKQRGSSTESE